MVTMTAQDAVKKIGNRFDLILIVARRARQIQVSVQETVVPGYHKCTILALQEIENNLVLPYGENDDVAMIRK